jgi:hypothetical protein
MLLEQLEHAKNQVRKTPSSAFYSCTTTGMHGPTCMFWAKLTPFSIQTHSERHELLLDYSQADQLKRGQLDGSRKQLALLDTAAEMERTPAKPVQQTPLQQKLTKKLAAVEGLERAAGVAEALEKARVEVGPLIDQKD